MSTLFTVLGIAFGLFLLKFIYDNFLTDNSEQAWQKLKERDPEAARMIEQNQGLNLKTSYRIREDGLYLWAYQGNGPNGYISGITIGLIFKKGWAYKFEVDFVASLSREDIQELLENATVFDAHGPSPDVSPFQLDGKQLHLHFYPDPEKTSNYLEAKGELTINGLRLDLTQHFINYVKADFDSQTLFTGAEFVFLPA
ncbi:hypothetical protein [Larkinella rosea]|uniref:Uncharacterized protein n=1 Tax=Larkinella rosea TaxID=2025312 RepID=A0A3P1C215_9BACT|nr:hypothetical protein [Larkinella rosea]RRB06844.1 hypothetical protein EHT25_03385 [Larkinella rosea]